MLSGGKVISSGHAYACVAMRKDKPSSIRVSAGLRKQLASLKKVPREPYEAVLERLIAAAGSARLSPAPVGSPPGAPGQ